MHHDNNLIYFPLESHYKYLCSYEPEGKDRLCSHISFTSQQKVCGNATLILVKLFNMWTHSCIFISGSPNVAVLVTAVWMKYSSPLTCPSVRAVTPPPASLWCHHVLPAARGLTCFQGWKWLISSDHFTVNDLILVQQFFKKPPNMSDHLTSVEKWKNTQNASVGGAYSSKLQPADWRNMSWALSEWTLVSGAD